MPQSVAHQSRLVGTTDWSCKSSSGRRFTEASAVADRNSPDPSRRNYWRVCLCRSQWSSKLSLFLTVVAATILLAQVAFGFVGGIIYRMGEVVVLAEPRSVRLPSLRRAIPTRQCGQHQPRRTEEEAEREAPAPRLASAGGKPPCEEAGGGPGERWQTE
jgi:hypothetical protein